MNPPEPAMETLQRSAPELGEALPRQASSERTPWLGIPAEERRFLLGAGDVAVAVLAVGFALWLWTFTSRVPFTTEYLRQNLVWLVTLVPFWLVLTGGLRDPRCAGSEHETVRVLLSASAAMGASYSAVYFFAAPGLLPRLVFLYFLWAVLSLEMLWRLAYLKVLASPTFQRRLLILGTGAPAQRISSSLLDLESHQYAVVGAIAETPGAPASLRGVPTLGGPADLAVAVSAHKVTEVVLANSRPLHDDLLRALLACQERGVDLVRMPVLYEQIHARVPVDQLATDWLLSSFVDTVRLNSLTQLVRRAVDVAGSLVGLLLLGLSFPLISLGILLESGRPVLFRQRRTGRGGREFWLLKFRTMRHDAEVDGHARWATPGDERVTRLGWLLRHTRLDELPQFLNVLRGDMSLVGPRPERPEFIAQLEKSLPFYRARLLVRPGITGWAQVNFRYGGSLDDARVKLEYDLYYVKRQSLWLDLVILARTGAVVLGLKGT